MTTPTRQHGDIANQEGDLYHRVVGVPGLEAIILKRGFVTVTLAQAEAAANYGWVVVGKQIQQPGFVTVTRPTMSRVVVVGVE